MKYGPVTEYLFGAPYPTGKRLFWAASIHLTNLVLRNGCIIMALGMLLANLREARLVNAIFEGADLSDRTLSRPRLQTRNDLLYAGGAVGK
jgi:uncharacterized protein YjbI with pentapeptide repeats